MSDPLHTKEYAEVIKAYRWGGSEATQARVASHVWIALCHVWTELSDEQREVIIKDAPPGARVTLELLPKTPRK